MFTKVALKEGPVDPEELIDAYIRANQSLWRVQKEMNANMQGALLLGTSPRDLAESLKRMSKKDFNNVYSGQFKPYFPSKDVIDGMFLNSKKIGAPNAFKISKNILLDILRKISRLKTDKGSEFPDLFNPLKKIMTPSGPQSSIKIQPNIPIETEQVSEEVVQTSALPSNVNQNTGLTSVEDALLSNEEKAMRLRQRGLTA